MNSEELASNYYIQVAISCDAYNHFSCFFLLDTISFFIIIIFFYDAGDLDRTSPGAARVSTPNNLATSQISESPQSGSMNNAIPESETAKVEETVEEEKKDIDPLDKFLPPPPKEKCSEELQVSFIFDTIATYSNFSTK